MIIAIANQKGGVGKTTTAINLAAALAQKGHRTILVDLDPQANASLSYVDIQTAAKSMYDVLVDPEVRLADVVQECNVENLKVAPARLALAKVEPALAGQLDAHFRLKDKLEAAKEGFDFVIIDTPPTLGMLTVNAMVAATHLLVPIQSSYFALEGTDDLLETYERIRLRANPGLQFLGVVVTIHDKRTILARDIDKQINEVFGDKVFRTRIGKNVRLEESPAYREPIFSFAPASRGAADYYSLSEEVLNRV
ncbi:MAG: ParA family protein [Acidobacteriota bacterium]|nr:ParA family protein [Acidobacteriota bacterium]MDQ7086781.1 ParA family protein [Acidobacteriota bacterium]